MSVVDSQLLGFLLPTLNTLTLNRFAEDCKPARQSGEVCPDCNAQLQSFNDELLRLKTECDTLAAQHKDLSVQCEARQAEHDSLVAEIESTHREHLDNFNCHLGPTSISGFDSIGKLNRRVWTLEQKNASLEEELKDAAARRRTDVDAERAIAASLRDRIGVLETRIRASEAVIDGTDKREAELNEAMKTQSVQFEASQVNLRRENEDLSEALRDEKRRSSALSEEVAGLRLEKQDLAERLRVAQAGQQQIPSFVDPPI